MKALDEIKHTRLLKRYYFLLRKLNKEGWATEEINSSVGKSPLDMDNEELMETCLKFERILNPKMPETETMRKKTVDSIVAWLELCGREKNTEAAKVIACFESGMRFFEEISVRKLTVICRDFKRKRKEFLSIEKEIAEAISSYNSAEIKQVFYGGQKLQHD